METYNGQVRTPQDAIILFEACRLGLLPRVQRRLSEKERQSIRSGSVFVWDEREAGMRRWTDGKSWSASRVSGSFLTYREMEGKRGASSFPPPNKTVDTQGGPQQEEAEEGPDGYRYKPDGLMKQSFSITTSQGQHLHLISYFARSHATAPGLNMPSTDPSLRSIRPQKGMYPESSLGDQSNVPAVTRSPMVGAPNYGMAQAPAYTQSSQPPQSYMPYAQQPQQHPGYQYPQSPMGAPPYHYPAYNANGLPPPGYAPYGQTPAHMNGYSPAGQAPPPNSYDQRPLRTPESSQPPQAQTQAGPAPMPQPYPNGGSNYPTASAPVQNSQPAYSQAAPSQYEHPHPAPHQPPRASPAQQAAAALQIDPRLTAAAALASPVPPMNPMTKEEQSENKENGSSTNARQAAKITSLVNGSADANPDVAKQDGEEKESRSPGGTKDGGSIQDIPSEKLGFREDKRALRQLDKVFAASAR